MNGASKCMTVTCRTTALPDSTYRGLCIKCYSAAKKLVEAGQTTWEDLEALDLCAVKSDPFTAEFMKRKKAGGEADRRPG